MPMIQGVFDGNADCNAGELWSAGLSPLANLRLRRGISGSEVTAFPKTGFR
jgi:hypothetical protein